MDAREHYGWFHPWTPQRKGNKTIWSKTTKHLTRSLETYFLHIALYFWICASLTWSSSKPQAHATKESQQVDITWTQWLGNNKLLGMISSIDATEGGEQNNLKQNNSVNHQMGLKLTLEISKAENSSMPSWESAGNKFKVRRHIWSKTTAWIINDIETYMCWPNCLENRNRFSTLISRLGTPQCVVVPCEQIVDIAGALRWRQKKRAAEPDRTYFGK